jgi:hypothetical protein
VNDVSPLVRPSEPELAGPLTAYVPADPGGAVSISSPVGRASEMLTPYAVPWPTLRTTNWQKTTSPGSTGPDTPRLAPFRTTSTIVLSTLRAGRAAPMVALPPPAGMSRPLPSCPSARAMFVRMSPCSIELWARAQ